MSDYGLSPELTTADLNTFRNRAACHFFGWVEQQDEIGALADIEPIHVGRTRQYSLYRTSIQSVATFTGKKGWITREPLLPLLAHQFREVLDFGDAAAQAVNEIIRLPEDRIRSRVVHGVLISALHHLEEVAPQYADPSP
jgi:hypothetical protein